jgi:hypothetical protein
MIYHYLIPFLLFSAWFALISYFTGGSWGLNGWAGITIFFAIFFGGFWGSDLIHVNYKKNPTSKFWYWWEDVRARVAGQERPK